MQKTNMQTQLISILIPTYKPDIHKFEKLLKSIRNQNTLQPEIVIGLQGNDNIENLIKKYDCKLIKFDRPSSYKTRINLIPYATWKYVWFVDCDDELPNSAIDNLIEIIESKDKEFDVIIFGVLEQFINKSKYPEKGIFETKKSILQMFYDTGNIQHSLYSKIIKTDVLRKTRFPDVDIFYGDDLIATKAILNSSDSLLSINQVFYIYKDPTGSNAKNAITSA